MMNMRANPFSVFEAEKEAPDVPGFFVPYSNYSSILDRAKNLGTAYVFGGCGSGKSATVIKIFDEFTNKAPKEIPLLVMIDSFDEMVRKGIENTRL